MQFVCTHVWISTQITSQLKGKLISVDENTCFYLVVARKERDSILSALGFSNFFSECNLEVRFVIWEDHSSEVSRVAGTFLCPFTSYIMDGIFM